MKKKIFEALKTKYSHLGLGDDTLDRIAGWLEPGVKEEKDIEAAIGAAGPVLGVLQSETDRLRNEKSGLMKQFEDYRKANPAKEGKDDDGKDDKKDGDDAAGPLTAEGVKSIVSELLKPVIDRFTEQDARDREAERRRQIMAKAAEYRIPEAVAKYMQVPPDADLDAFMKQAKQDFADSGFSEVKPPQTAEDRMRTESEAIAKMISDGTKSIVESQKK
jgi:hypothetical protein